ncbi:MAG: ATP-binding cassette domain-containing protein [Rhizobiales bacterium]|nr:ATP-binding cassette domain-containing protein [Hyphomicrobiales bacterium]
MEPKLFKYIWRHSRKEQIWVLAVVLISLPFYFMALDLPKRIVNSPIQGQGFERPDATATFLDVNFAVPGFLQGVFGEQLDLFGGFELERFSYLLALSMTFLMFVCINGLFKFYINSYKGKMGERMLRRLRYELVDRLLRFPLTQFRKVRPSEAATMVKDEVEPLGGFIGEAFVAPVFLGGQALTALIFILLQSAWLGAMACAIIFIQSVLIPRLRRRLLVLGKQRQLTARELAGRVGEIVEGVAEVRANDTSNFERADITRRLGQIFWIRFEIYQRKFFVKFLNNFLAQFTPFLFYLVGGYFAIRGNIDIGQLVAVIAAYKDLPSPIKELIDWDQQRLDIQIKYQQVAEQFAPENMLAPEIQEPVLGAIEPLSGDVSVRRLTLADEGGAKMVESVSFNFSMGEHVAAVGSVNSGGEYVAEALAKLIVPASGAILVDGRDLNEMPEAITGRRIAYVAPEVYLRPLSIEDNLLYGLRHVPTRDASRSEEETLERERRLVEARKAGNLMLDPDADWTDYEAAGTSGPEEMDARIIEVLNLVGLADNIFEFGLRGTLDPGQQPELAARFVTARSELRQLLDDPEMAQLIEPFEPDRYNFQATVAENLLFGTPVGQDFTPASLASDPYILQTLKAADLYEELLTMGHSIASTVVELFADLPPDHPFFEQVSFMAAEDLPEYEAIVKRVPASDPASASEQDRERLLSLPFSYIEPRHRLGLLDGEQAQSILKGRELFHRNLPEERREAIEFYDPENYNAASSLQDNILLGRIAYGVAGAQERIGTAIRDVLARLDLTQDVFRIGLDYNVGNGGKRLNVVQRQKISLARALLKRPDLIVVNRALSALDPASQDEIIKNVRQAVSSDGRRTAIFWVVARPEMAKLFDIALVFEEGRLVRQGQPSKTLEAAGEMETVEA